MLEMNLAFTRPWTVRLPTLVRQMNIEYVDAFFNDGSLRLSSFESFRRNPDEKRKDTQEGLVAMQVNTPTNTLSILGTGRQTAYIVCASTIEKPLSEFEMKSISSFRIHDSLKFADAVARQIPGFSGGTEGLCNYRTNTMITKNDSTPRDMPNDPKDIEAWFKNENANTARLAIDAYFMKNISFAHESEYRFIWFTESPREQFLDIKCPEAIKYCERIDENLSKILSDRHPSSGSQTFAFGEF